MTTPIYTEYNERVGGEVRFYEAEGKWRYVCAMGEGRNLASLEAAQAEVESMLDAAE